MTKTIGYGTRSFFASNASAMIAASSVVRSAPAVMRRGPPVASTRPNEFVLAAFYIRNLHDSAAPP